MAETTRAELPVRPFYCGTQYMDWLENNCYRGCSKAAPVDATLDEMPCEIERALSWACMDDGTVSAEMGRRMGLPRWEGYYSWPCPEHDPPWAEEGPTDG